MTKGLLIKLIVLINGIRICNGGSQEWNYFFDDIDIGSGKIGEIFGNIENLFRSRKADEESLYILHPFSPVLICEHHYGWTDKDDFGYFYVNEINATRVGPYDVVCCQSDEIESFVTIVLPQILTPIILITHKWNAPFLVPSNYTDALLNDSLIAHWFAHNPFFHQSHKISPFPYGINPNGLKSYFKAIKSYKMSSKNIKTTSNETKYEYPFKRSETVIANLNFRVDNHFSRQIIPFNKTFLGSDKYYEEISNYKYVISPHGDRPDCYRHWESIGLGAVPIANINASIFNTFSLRENHFLHRGNRENLFSVVSLGTATIRHPHQEIIVNGTKIEAGGNMVFMEADNIAYLLNSSKQDGMTLLKEFDRAWNPPQRHLTSVIYWACKIYTMKEKFREKNLDIKREKL